jgi:hypothetical protein
MKAGMAQGQKKFYHDDGVERTNMEHLQDCWYYEATGD